VSPFGTTESFERCRPFLRFYVICSRHLVLLALFQSFFERGERTVRRLSPRRFTRGPSSDDGFGVGLCWFFFLFFFFFLLPCWIGLFRRGLFFLGWSVFFFFIRVG